MAQNPAMFHNGEIQYVLFHMFSKGGNRGQKRCVRAPFSIVKHDGETYMMPVSGGFGVNLYGSDDQDEALYQAREDFGFVSAEVVVMREHEMGDFNGPDTWKSVHAFSQI